MMHPEDLVLSKSWYLFQCRSGKEDRASEEIERLGHTTAVPKVKRMVRLHSRSRKKHQERTYVGFKSHVLVGFGVHNPISDHLRSILDIHWVTGVVGLGDFASRLNGRQVFRFLNHPTWDKRSVEKLVSEWQPDYVEGDTVKLRGAGLDGITGLVWSVNLERRKAQVTVPFLGTEREIEVPLEAAYLTEKAA